MEVILLEKVENLGSVGDKVSVKPGYGRNFLVPQGKAKLATPANLAAFEAHRADLEKKAAQELADAEAREAKARDTVLKLSAKSGTEGKLFGSIGTIDIAHALEAQGIEISRSEIRLPDGPLREVGEHVVSLHLHTDVNVQITVNVVAEESE